MSRASLLACVLLSAACPRPGAHDAGSDAGAPDSGADAGGESAGGGSAGGGAAGGEAFFGGGPGGGFGTPYGAKVDYPTALEPTSVALADFNLDGKLDIAVACPGVVSVLVQVDGGFLPHQDFDAGLGPNSVLAASDLNGDGFPDLAVANGGEASVSVLLATPGGFSPQVKYATQGHARSIAVADFNADGRADLAVAEEASTVAVFLNARDGGFFSRSGFTVGSAPHDVAAADFNGDGRPDLAVVSSTGQAVAVLFNTTPANGGTPSFATGFAFGGNAGASSVKADDLNGDGRPDLVVASGAQGLVILMNSTPMNGTTPSFHAPSSFMAGTQTYWAATGDLDRDGLSDLVVSDAYSAQLLLYRNLTDAGAPEATLALPATVLETGNNPWSVAVGTLNADPRLDLVTANGGGDSVSVFIAR